MTAMETLLSCLAFLVFMVGVATSAVGVILAIKWLNAKRKKKRK